MVRGDVDRAVDAESQRGFGKNDRWPPARQQDAEDSDRSTGSSTNGCAPAPAYSGANRCAECGGSANGGGVAAHRCRAISVNHLRLDRYGRSVSQRQIGQLHTEAGSTFDATSFFSFRDASTDRLSALRDHYAIDHQRLRQRRRKSVARLVPVRRQILVDPNRDVSSGLDREMSRNVRRWIVTLLRGIGIVPLLGWKVTLLRLRRGKLARRLGLIERLIGVLIGGYGWRRLLLHLLTRRWLRLLGLIRRRLRLLENTLLPSLIERTPLVWHGRGGLILG